MIIQTIEIYIYRVTYFIIHFFNKINKQSHQVDWRPGEAYVFVFSTNVMCPILVGNCKQPLAIPSCIPQIESGPYTITDDHQKITADHAGIISDNDKIIADHDKIISDHAIIILNLVKMTFDHAEIIFNRIKIAPDPRKITYDESVAGSTKPTKTFFSFFITKLL